MLTQTLTRATEYNTPTVLSSAPTVTDVLAGFAPIGLAGLQDVALLRRVDTKLVLHQTQLICALRQLHSDYEILEIEGRRLHRYRTLYFDTADYALYHQHHNGQSNRYKVRARTYEDSGLAFLEVKRKNAQGLTIKERLQIPEIIMQFGPAGSDFLSSVFPYPVDGLTPVLWNRFQRVTLVNRQRAERVTLDFDVSFRAGQLEIALPGVAIAEIKQSGYALRSEFIGQLRRFGVRPMRFSKYCIGLSLLAPQVKHNHFKPQQLYLKRIIQGGV